MTRNTNLGTASLIDRSSIITGCLGSGVRFSSKVDAEFDVSSCAAFMLSSVSIIVIKSWADMQLTAGYRILFVMRDWQEAGRARLGWVFSKSQSAGALAAQPSRTMSLLWVKDQSSEDWPLPLVPHAYAGRGTGR